MSTPEWVCDACGMSLWVGDALRFDLYYYNSANHVVCKGGCDSNG